MNQTIKLYHLVDMTKYILQNQFSDHESQLWQINENSALIAKVWNSSNKWELKPINANFVHIENSSNGKFLSATKNNKIVEEALNKAKAEQEWEKGTPDDEGFFVLISSSKKVLTAISATELQIKGMTYLIVLLPSPKIKSL